jgi:hypothetical protein
MSGKSKSKSAPLTLANLRAELNPLEEALEAAREEQEKANSQMYDEDPEYFNHHITEEDHEDLEDKHQAKWAKLKGEKLRVAKRKAYYDLMKKKYDSELQSMKQAYIEDMNKEDLDLVEQEDVSEVDEED